MVEEGIEKHRKAWRSIGKQREAEEEK